MKLPSVQQILQDARLTFLRFPFVLINAILGTFAAVILADHEGPAQASVLFKILLAAILGIPLLTGMALLAERKKWGIGKAAGLQLIGIFLLAGYACAVPSDLANAPAIHIIRQIMLAVALHLFVAFAPFSDPGGINGFWQYNKILFLRLINTGVYSVVLFAGLALALAALENLFGMNVPGKRYAELWFIILGMFNTWTFLAGIPDNLAQLEELTDYPKVIKIFAQYILLPLVFIYLVILYAYMAKILIAWDWPQGWVSRLILGFATTGIFSVLLLHPIRELADNTWIKRASGWLYILMIPLVVMLLLALWRRISEYGITESRYIAICLGIWLGGIVVYFIISRKKSIKTIPVSLCFLTLFISFGPWSAFRVSEQSQIDRLDGYLAQNKILVNGRIQKAAATIPQGDVLQISSIITYLHDIHGFEQIQPWFGEDLKEDSPGAGMRYKEPAAITKMMGIEYVNVWQSPAGDDIFFRSDQVGVMDVQGYDCLIRGQYFNLDRDERTFSDQQFGFRVSPALDKIVFTVKSEGTVYDSLQVDLNPWINKLLDDYGNISVRNMPAEKMMIKAENRAVKIKMYFQYIRLSGENNLVKPTRWGADILCGTNNIN